jgi:hypothetical protein
MKRIKINAICRMPKKGKGKHRSTIKPISMKPGAKNTFRMRALANALNSIINNKNKAKAKITIKNRHNSKENKTFNMSSILGALPSINIGKLPQRFSMRARKPSSKYGSNYNTSTLRKRKPGK